MKALDPDRRRQLRFLRRMRAGSPTVILPNRTHGKRSTYVSGCRCDPCTDAEAEYYRSREGIA